MRLNFHQIDAFASRAFEGNPAAVMPLDAWLDDATLQAIAMENNLAETAYIVPRSDGVADYDLRWFTPAIEVELCGHATLASGHFVLSADASRDAVTFATNVSGVLEVRRNGSGYALSLPALPCTPAPLDAAVDAALGASPEALLRHPKGYLIAVFADAATLRALTPDMRATARLPEMTVIATAPGDGANDIISRVFVPAAGIDEDPVTGSAHAALAPYWAARLDRDSFTAFQASPRGGHLHCTLAGDRVVLRGECVTVVEGAFLL
jgi:PhzF family phenazine biosynthesis protein